MAEYLLRKVSNNFEISKFEDTSLPTAVYKVSHNSCTCPSTRLCKHIKILDKWKKAGSIFGEVYGDTTEKVGQLCIG